MQILLTFAGVRDPFNADGVVDGQTDDGPVLSLLSERQFDRVYVFADARLLDRARHLIQVIKERASSTKTQIVEIDLPDPTDYEAIFYGLNRECRAILETHERDHPDYFIAPRRGRPRFRLSGSSSRSQGFSRPHS